MRNKTIKIIRKIANYLRRVVDDELAAMDAFYRQFA